MAFQGPATMPFVPPAPIGPQADPELLQIIAELRSAGIQPPTTQDMAQSQAPLPQFQANGFQRFLEGLAGAQPSGPPGFASGLLKGLASGGGRIAEKRAQFEESAARRRAQQDAERVQASKDYQAAFQEKLKGLENKPGTAAYRAKIQRIGDEEAAKLGAKANAPESPTDRRTRERQDRLDAAAAARDQRMAEAAQRAADAADRANRTANATIENQITDDYKTHPSVVAYDKVRSNLITAEASSKLKSGAGDLAIIYSYQRALEPDNQNVVREGERDTARAAAGQLQKLQNVPSRFFKGTDLTEEGRQFFLNQMRTSLKARRGDFEEQNRIFRDRAKRYGIPDTFVLDRPTTDSGAPFVPPPGGFFDKNRPQGAH